LPSENPFRFLGSSQGRSRAPETEAAAFAGLSAIGLEAGTADYVVVEAMWSPPQGHSDESLAFIQQTASEILEAILPTQQATEANAASRLAYSSAAVINGSGQSIGRVRGSSLGSNSSRIGRATFSNFQGQTGDPRRRQAAMRFTLVRKLLLKDTGPSWLILKSNCTPGIASRPSSPSSGKSVASVRSTSKGEERELSAEVLAL
jgi:hypothetical protein